MTTQMEEVKERLAELDADYRDKWVAYQAAQEDLKQSREARTKFLEKSWKHIDVHTCDDETLKMIMLEGRNEMWAHNLMAEWFGEPFSEVSYGGGWHHIDDTHYYPDARLCFTRNQGVSSAKTKVLRIVDALMRIFEVDEIILSVFEKGLSENGIWTVLVRSESEAVLQHTFYGSTRDVFAGTLEDVLAKVSRELYYRSST